MSKDSGTVLLVGLSRAAAIIVAIIAIVIIAGGCGGVGAA
jgi:hypothetical protein